MRLHLQNKRNPVVHFAGDRELIRIKSAFEDVLLNNLPSLRTRYCFFKSYMLRRVIQIALNLV